jgi:hypothetical protein
VVPEKNILDSEHGNATTVKHTNPGRCHQAPDLLLSQDRGVLTALADEIQPAGNVPA